MGNGTTVRRIDAIALAAVLYLFGVGRISAQTCNPGEVRAFIKDSQESPIFDVQVHLISQSSDIGVQTTGTEGTADFKTVPCGSVTVSTAKEGFEDSSKTVQALSGATVEVTLVLTPKIVRSNVDVTEKPPPVEQSASQNNQLHPAEVKPLPGNPATVTDTLPLIPGVVRTPDGELKIDGSGEQRSALVVNQSDVTDPATGEFGRSLPIDSVETMNVLTTPFLAQYGRFTQSVVAVETKRGGEKWHADLNDPFPDVRVRSYRVRGIRNETPRSVLGGPIIPNRLYFITALTYFLDKVPNRTLPFPYNESKQEWLNSFSQMDFIASPKQIINATLHIAPQHTNFVNPEYFNPEPVTPTYSQHIYIGTLADHYGLWNGTLDSSISFQHFNGFVGSQGPDAMVLTPEGNSGNYFGNQNRTATRNEWLEIWSPAPVTFLGNHLFKLGSSLTNSNDQGQFTYRDVDILNTAGQQLERISFSNPSAYDRSDREVTAYVQDHWSPTSRFSFDYGARIEHQKLASSLRIAPRAGLAWTPFADQRTVFRAGYGEFYDHIPLDVYTFGRFPERTITDYAPDGSIIGSPIQYVNVIGSITGPRSFLIHGQQVAGAFSPRGSTWNVQLEHAFSRLLHIRGVYTDNRSVGLIVLEPDLAGPTNEIVLNGDGSSRYRQAEVTAKFAWQKDQQLIVTYTRSHAEGSLNEFDTFLGNFPTPIIHPDVYSNLPADLPNRFLTWGHVDPHFWRFQIFPIVEYRNGFPYATYDASQNYVGVPYNNRTRFPDFFSADARISRDFKVTAKYTVRLSLTAFNMTDHFNALAVHDNIADPQYGLFFGNYHRRYRGDFEVVF